MLFEQTSAKTRATKAQSTQSQPSRKRDKPEPETSSSSSSSSRSNLKENIRTLGSSNASLPQGEQSNFSSHSSERSTINTERRYPNLTNTYFQSPISSPSDTSQITPFSMQTQYAYHSHQSPQQATSSGLQTPAFFPQSQPGQPQQQQETSPFSNMMFPSSNPFAYPNPPITSLEQAGVLRGNDIQVADPQHQFPPGNTNAGMATPADDYMDVNMLGMPNFANGLQGGPGLTSNGHFDMNNMPNNAGGSSGQQVHLDPTNMQFPGMDFSDFFGSGNWDQRM